MSKRTVFTTVTPLPSGITRESVMETLYNHVEMIDLNPLVEERHPVKPPGKALPEEINCKWYSLTDKVQYLPGGLASGKIQYFACFHDLPTGIQTHVYAPMGLDIKGLWTLGGSLPGEPISAQPLGVGVPKQGLWLREDVDMKCNFVMTSFVKKTLKKAHACLVDRLVEKAHLLEAKAHNDRISLQHRPSSIHSNSSFPGTPQTQYSVPSYSDASSIRGSNNSPMLSPRIGYTNPRMSMLGASPSYTTIDPAYQQASGYLQHPDNRQSYLPPPDPRLSYMAPQDPRQQQYPQDYKHNYMQQPPEPRSFAAELPADDGMLLYHPRQSPGLNAQTQDQKAISELQPGTSVDANAASDGRRRFQLQDMQPAPLNPSRSPPPQHPGAAEMAA